MVFFTKKELNDLESKSKKTTKIMIISTILFILLITLSLIFLNYMPMVLGLILDIVFTFLLISIVYFCVYNLVDLNRKIKLYEEMNNKSKSIKALINQIKTDYTIDRFTYIEIVATNVNDNCRIRIFYPKQYEFTLKENTTYNFIISSYNIIREYQNEED